MTTLSRRAAIAAALAEADGRPVSGERLAAELGISRVALRKHVAALRELGYRIEAAPHIGYRLLAAPDSCIPEEVAPRLTHALWASCEGAAEVSSTNDLAKELARSGAPEGTLVVAGSQSAGRGRFGRRWVSPGGGVYASFVLRPRCTPAELAPLSLAVAVGAARALEEIGVPIGLKWPNDLLADDAKLGGVLLEMAAEAERVEWLVVGIGINVDDPGEAGTTGVRRFADGGAAEVAARVLDACATAHAAFTSSGFAPMRAEYERRLVLAGRDVRVRDLDGALVAEGVAAGVDERGALLVDSAAGRVAISAGDVTLRR